MLKKYFIQKNNSHLDIHNFVKNSEKDELNLETRMPFVVQASPDFLEHLSTKGPEGVRSIGERNPEQEVRCNVHSSASIVSR